MGCVCERERDFFYKKESLLEQLYNKYIDVEDRTSQVLYKFKINLPKDNKCEKCNSLRKICLSHP